MPSQEDFTRMEALARNLTPDSPGHAYGPWLAARGAGLKDQARTALEAFLAAALSWPDERRQSFILWLDDVRGRLDDPGAATPRPLMTRLVLPTLRAWAESDPAAAMPHLLLARFHSWSLDETEPLDHYRRALARDPRMETARRGVIHALFDQVQYSQHHLPDSYLGDREADAARMDEAAELARSMTEKDERDTLIAHAAVLRDRALGVRSDGGLAAYGFPIAASSKG